LKYVGKRPEKTIKLLNPLKSKPSVAIVSGASADAGIWIPVLDGLSQSHSWEMQLILTGSHTLNNSTSASIFTEKGYTRYLQVMQKRPVITLEDMGIVCAELVQDFIACFQQNRPELLMLLGDRYETYSAALAAWFLQIPIAHIHGGETTEGALDDGFRNSISHFARLHFTAHPKFKEKLIRMGLPSENIFLTGAPGLDRFRNLILPDRKSTLQYVGLHAEDTFILVVFHPVTQQSDTGLKEWTEVQKALDKIPGPIVVQMSSPDAGAQALISQMQLWAQAQKGKIIPLLHPGEYWFPALMKHCLFMMGNSSSALIEAPYFNTPVLNIGIRQQGRLSSEKVLHVPADENRIYDAIRNITTNPEDARPNGSPYGNGRAVQAICREMEHYFDALKNDTSYA
jgi:UDP-hydrolysing UDP-N-acetyl-D-glucosamine 2-epimerase